MNIIDRKAAAYEKKGMFVQKADISASMFNPLFISLFVFLLLLMLQQADFPADPVHPPHEH